MQDPIGCTTLDDAEELDDDNPIVETELLIWYTLVGEKSTVFWLVRLSLAFDACLRTGSLATEDGSCSEADTEFEPDRPCQRQV